MIKYVQQRVEAGGGKDVHKVYEANGAEETDMAIWNAWCETETQAAGEAWPTSFTHHSLQLEVIPTIYLNSLLNYIAIW